MNKTRRTIFAVAVCLMLAVNLFALTKLTGVSLINSVINSTTIGATTPSTAAFTTLAASSTTTLNGAVGGSHVVGNSGNVQLAGTMSGTAGDLVCDNGAQNTTTNCKQVRTGVGSPCTTGGSSFDVCSMTITWSSAFSATTYSPACFGIGATDPRANILDITSRSTGSMVIRLVTEGSNPISYSSVVCIGVL